MYLLGLGISGYSLYVSTSFEKDPENYRPLCDVEEGVSCSSVLTSKYAKGFGLVGGLMGDEAHPLNQPNSVYGLAFYGLNFLLFAAFRGRSFVAELQFYAVILANFVSCYLAYLLYAVLKNLCYVCVATYAVNFLLLILHFYHRRNLRLNPVPEYSKFERRGNSNFQPTLPQFDFKKNI